MKVIICGASQIADELLKRLGENWEVTLVEKDEKRMRGFSNRFVTIDRIVTGDASSPVVLEEASLGNQDYVLALTDNDQVNQAVARFATEKKIRHIMALVYDPENLPKFQEFDVWALPVTSFMARKIYHYLQDPRMKISLIGQGEGELLEIEIGPNLMVMGKKASDFKDENWHVVGILRDGNLLYPDNDTVFKEGDRLLILGKPDLVKAVCSTTEFQKPNFPLIYGNELVIGVPAKSVSNESDIISEGLYLAQNTKIHDIYVLCEKNVCNFKDELQRWSESLDIHVQESDQKVNPRIKHLCKEKNVGAVVLPSMESAFLDSMTQPSLIHLAHSLPCPLLVSKATHPYRDILVPYNGSPKTKIALEVAIDLSCQMTSSVTVVVVKEPEFLHSDEAKDDAWVNKQLKNIREMARIHKIQLKEELRAGNPVKEITALAKQYDLMILGSEKKEKNFFSPHVGELMVRKSSCSTLIVTE
jgi:Trk K+ transport system NAD-binding subunit/nucleotide-binding universal stress UspA family protein